jgi:hypothetical protein
VLAVGGLILAPMALVSQGEKTGISVTILAPGETAEAETSDSLSRQDDRRERVEIQRAGVVTTSLRELSFPPTTDEQAWLLLSVLDERGTAAGWEVSLLTEPAGVFGLLIGRTDTITLIHPQQLLSQSRGDVANGRYVGLIEAGSVPLLVAPPGSGDGLWTQPLDFGFPDSVEGSYVGEVVLVLNLTFAP